MATAVPSQQGDADLKIKAVIDNITKLDLSTFEDVRKSLDELSPRTSIDEIEVDPEGVLIDDDHFRGIFNVYLTLEYDGPTDDRPRTSESFEGKFKGRFEAGKPVVEEMKVDTSAFYE